MASPRRITDAVFFLQWKFQGGPAPSCPAQNVPPPGLPDTGQTSCYRILVNQDWIAASCGDAACAGQDGSHPTGCPSEGRFVDNLDETLTDTCTGLMWQKDTADTNGDGKSTEQDFLPWCKALAYCEDLSFGGHDDWRLPNVRELQSIVSYGRPAPAIDPFFRAFSSPYWSSTTYAANPGLAWYITFADGYVSNNGKIATQHVRAVRDAP